VTKEKTKRGNIGVFFLGGEHEMIQVLLKEEKKGRNSHSVSDNE